ncbi:MAG: hypothetical protein IPG04_04690 [Polyangiaceae bacterium]|nr:hypothetical protein [Polyangiaceae bacterium]
MSASASASPVHTSAPAFSSSKASLLRLTPPRALPRASASEQRSAAGRSSLRLASLSRIASARFDCSESASRRPRAMSSASGGDLCSFCSGPGSREVSSFASLSASSAPRPRAASKRTYEATSRAARACSSVGRFASAFATRRAIEAQPQGR